jgi:hypothetical protein
MWYNLSPLKNTTIRTCFQCGSKLILISKKTQRIEGARFSQTVCEYRCTNIKCQDEKDREKKKRIKLLKEKAKADLERNKNKLASKKNISLGKRKK